MRYFNEKLQWDVFGRQSKPVSATFALWASVTSISALARDSAPATALDPVVVTASPFTDRSELDLAQPVSVLQGEELRRKREARLGDTLSRELGVTSSAFGPAAGRPIIRGLDGPRIRVLEGGIGTLDISTLSPDHMVTTESLNASQIEILRGPATLLYGSGASGGVVNVVNGRIPQRVFKSPKGNFELRGNSATDERSGGFNVMGSVGQASWNVDGFKRKTADYDTPVGRVGNSAVDAHSLGLGGSWVGEKGFLGASVHNWKTSTEYQGATAQKLTSSKPVTTLLANWMARFGRLSGSRYAWATTTTSMLKSRVTARSGRGSKTRDSKAGSSFCMRQ